MQRLTKKSWFGKKKVGYGPAPATWQGWLITFLLILTVVLDFLHFRISITSILIFIIALMVFFAITILTGGKPSMDRERTGNPIITGIFIIIWIALILLLDTMTYLNHDFTARLIVNVSIAVVFVIVYLIFIRKL